MIHSTHFDVYVTSPTVTVRFNSLMEINGEFL